MANSSLTTGAQKQLKDHEDTIERGLSSFVEVGNSLVAIRDSNLYTDVADTFELYCKKRWNFGRAHAYRYIKAARVVENLSPIGDIEVPNSEAIARVLASVPDENRQADVWVKANETAPKDKAGNPKITAAHVRKVIEESLSPVADPVAVLAANPVAEPEPMLDANGRDLPPELVAVFERQAEFNSALRNCRDLAELVKTLGTLSPFLHVQSCVADLNNAKQAIKFAKPYAVCPYCKGKKCQGCKQTGWVPKNVNETAPEDKK